MALPTPSVTELYEAHSGGLSEDGTRTYKRVWVVTYPDLTGHAPASDVDGSGRQPDSAPDLTAGCNLQPTAKVLLRPTEELSKNRLTLYYACNIYRPMSVEPKVRFLEPERKQGTFLAPLDFP